MKIKLTYWALGYGVLWLDREHAGVNEDNIGGWRQKLQMRYRTPLNLFLFLFCANLKNKIV